MRYVLTLIFVLLASTALAGQGMYPVPMVYQGAAPACSTPTTGDEFNEGFLGTGYENTWTETVGTGGTVDEDYSLPGSPPTGSCSEGLQTAVTTSGTATYTTHDLGSALSASSDIDIVWYFYVDSSAFPMPDDRFVAFAFDDDTTVANNNVARVTLGNDSSGNLSVRGMAASNTPYIGISEDTWYRATLHLDGTTAANSSIDIDSWNGSTWSDVGSGTFTRGVNGGRYFRVGPSHELDADEAISFITGYVSINTP